MCVCVCVCVFNLNCFISAKKQPEHEKQADKDGSTVSLSSYIIYIAIAGAILVIVGYIAYHNRDYVSIVCDLLISIDHHTCYALVL